MNGQLTASQTTCRLSHAEELANSFTHGVGFVMSLAGAAVMAVAPGPPDGWRMLGCAVYVASLNAVYAMSTLSHIFQAPRLRTIFRSLDQGSIYLLVAGTFTPFSLTYLRTGPWLTLLAMIWAVALWGFFSKVLFAHRVESVNMWPCIIIGAMPFIAIPSLLDAISIEALWWMLAGVGCYIAGLWFWVNDRRVRHFHAVWHVLVIAGSAIHFMGILFFVVQVG